MAFNSRVFVYGTLRRDEVNHHLLAGAVYHGRHVTGPYYSMLHLGGYPGVVKGGRTRIQGEVYAVGAETLAGLDRLEGYPRDYTRELIRTPWGLAWIYIYRGPRRSRRPIADGTWRETIFHRRWTR